jgi:hypothetical protein
MLAIAAVSNDVDDRRMQIGHEDEYTVLGLSSVATKLKKKCEKLRSLPKMQVRQVSIMLIDSFDSIYLTTDVRAAIIIVQDLIITVRTIHTNNMVWNTINNRSGGTQNIFIFRVLFCFFAFVRQN